MAAEIDKLNKSFTMVYELIDNKMLALHTAVDKEMRDLSTKVEERIKEQASRTEDRMKKIFEERLVEVERKLNTKADNIDTEYLTVHGKDKEPEPHGESDKSYTVSMADSDYVSPKRKHLASKQQSRGDFVLITSNSFPAELANETEEQSNLTNIATTSDTDNHIVTEEHKDINTPSNQENKSKDIYLENKPLNNNSTEVKKLLIGDSLTRDISIRRFFPRTQADHLRISTLRKASHDLNKVQSTTVDEIIIHLGTNDLKD
uniref:Uncharacterized protein LOC102804381 n=1 Tax=Saccoglossus kowalevskii TaxID=10224 RepID=A0ABM0MMM8_SACKO